MDNKTAVGWLYNELLNSEPNILEWNKLLEQAKEMEKEQILDAYECGFESEHDARIPQSSMIYYKQTYGGGEQ
jgi:NADH:ubiquinone oxidoreductase subunit 3 (subunit A)